MALEMREVEAWSCEASKRSEAKRGLDTVVDVVSVAG